jgi:hypothetical protein
MVSGDFGGVGDRERSRYFNQSGGNTANIHIICHIFNYIFSPDFHDLVTTFSAAKPGTMVKDLKIAKVRCYAINTLPI